MPTVDPRGLATMPQPPAMPKAPAVPSSPAERANNEAAQLLKHFNAAKMAPDGFVPHVGMPGGADIPKPHGLYTPRMSTTGASTAHTSTSSPSPRRELAHSADLATTWAARSG